jgi:RNA polymerase sigma-70 factor (TIGR02943 family)
MQPAAATVFDADIAARACLAAACGGSARTSQRLHPIDLESYRPGLTRYALRMLRNAADAQDAVQDTLAAAVTAPDAFAGRSSPKTWLYGILKHKIIDTFRRQARETVLADLSGGESQGDIEALFAPDGRWREPPAHWGSPEVMLQQRDFLEVLEACIACLPERAAKVFTMREVMELEVDEICGVLGISANHCFVMLHRARLKLRALLEERWFAAQASAPN